MRNTIALISIILMLIGLSNITLATPISLHDTHAGTLGYTIIGGSELIETNGGYSNCGNGAASSATLSLPAGATVKAAYLYWYAMESNSDDGYSTIALSNTAPITFPGVSSTITASRNFSDSMTAPGFGTWVYKGYFSDVTAQVQAQATVNGNYTVDVVGGASNAACPLTEENVRGWNMVFVYEDPAITNPNKIYIYDGMAGFLNSSIIVPVTGYHVPTLQTSGSMAVVSLQGDSGLPGEYMTTSDSNFPDYPVDYANGDQGGGLDIDINSGNFTANSTSMNLNAGSNNDLILLTNIVLSISSDLDFGDAPASYGEASHTVPVSPTLYLGAVQPDADSGSQVSANADGDNSTGSNDEDGVTISGIDLTAGNTETLSVAVQGNGVLNAWVDLNQDGDFADVGEQIANELSASTGTTSLSVAIPAGVSSGSQIMARFRLCSATGKCNASTGTTDDGEVEDYAFAVASSCSALSGDLSEVAAAIPIQIASGDKVFVASSSPVPGKQGHFKAYTIQSNGSVATTVDWDADEEMDSTDRQLQLFSTDALGSKILFNLLDDAAFNSSGTDPVVAKIKEYSFNPSVDAETYLAGRASGSYLGTLGRGNDVALLENKINTWLYLDDSAYRTFATTIRNRPQKALLTSDDGFVYAFKQSDGDLAWGWMPRQLVKELKDYSGFQDNRYMSGMLDTLEFKYSGSYGAYVIGSYKDGLGQYTLKLDTTDNDNLEAVVWDQDYSLVANGLFDEAPNHGEREYFKDGNGNTYTAYILSKSNLSTLIIKKLGDASAATEVALDFHVTSTPFVMPDFGDNQAPAKKTIYLGAENGEIKRAALLDGASLETAANIKIALQGTAVGRLADNDESIIFLGAASAESGRGYYMRAQSQQRLTVLKYNSATTNWDHIWTSYVTGAGTWDSGNSYTADTSGVPTDNDSDGFFTDVTENGIQSIPTGSRITDAAHIVAGAIVLPVSVPATGSCSGKAYYYLYKLSAGVFPDAKFMQLDHTPITGNIALGYGEPKRVEIADNTTTNETIGFGNTDQKIDNTTGVSASFLINDTVATGTRGWKERTQ